MQLLSTKLSTSQIGGRRARRLRRAAPSLLAAAVVLVAGVALAQTPEATTTVTTGHLRQWLGVDIMDLIRKSDLMGKASLVVLAIFSIISWMVIVYKFLHLRQAKRQTDQFVEVCNQGSGQLEEAYKVAADYPDSPLAQILREGYLELEVENWYRDGYDLEPAARIEMAKVGIERVLERTIAHEISHLESKLIFLATTSNVCPFIGLFGTVWGIMAALQAMAATGGGSLASLLPGLATALLTVAGGLVCAIPASAMYNYFTHQVSNLISRMDAFALELNNVILKELVKQPYSPPVNTLR